MRSVADTPLIAPTRLPLPVTPTGSAAGVADTFTSSPAKVEHFAQMKALARTAMSKANGVFTGNSAEPGAVKPGQLDYYRLREEDFMKRHPGDNQGTPPDYYLGYGDKYAHRFTEHLKPQLSQAGQGWLDRTFVNLQNAMEAKRNEDPAAFAKLEENPDEFRKFAYGTHAKAYLDAGLAKLPTADLIKVAGTPDCEDLWSKDGVGQIEDVARGIFSSHGIDFLAHQTKATLEHPGAVLGGLVDAAGKHLSHLGSDFLHLGKVISNWFHA